MPARTKCAEHRCVARIRRSKPTIRTVVRIRAVRATPPVGRFVAPPTSSKPLARAKEANVDAYHVWYRRVQDGRKRSKLQQTSRATFVSIRKCRWILAHVRDTKRNRRGTTTDATNAKTRNEKQRKHTCDHSSTNGSVVRASYLPKKGEEHLDGSNKLPRRPEVHVRVIPPCSPSHPRPIASCVTLATRPTLGMMTNTCLCENKRAARSSMGRPSMHDASFD